MYKKPLLSILFIMSILNLYAQQMPVDIFVSLLAGYNGPDQVPFWMRSNKFGSVPPEGVSAGLIGSVHKDYDRSGQKKIDWGAGFEGRLNAGDPVKFLLLEGYGKIRYGIIELKAGRVKDITGLCDTLLSSGSWGVSGNAPGIPKIEISIPDFVPLPFWDGLFAVKASYANGIIGKWKVYQGPVAESKSYLLQHTFYGRLGKADWKLKLYGGFNHQVVWGNERDILGEEYRLNGVESFIYANLAKSYSNGNIKNMRVGNHLGSIDIGLTYDFDDLRVFLYRQFLYDAGALYYLASLRDGLNGVSVANKTPENRNIGWNRILIEFLYTKNQAGETWSPYTTSPYENYYNNGYYDAGWSYRGVGLGNPLISSPGTIREELPATGFNSFENNRVIALHGGFEWGIYGWKVMNRLTWSWNYGTYDTSPDGKIYGGENTEAPYGIFPVTRQFSGWLSATKELQKGITIGFMGAVDLGGLYEDGVGAMAVVRKKL